MARLGLEIVIEETKRLVDGPRHLGPCPAVLGAEHKLDPAGHPGRTHRFGQLDRLAEGNQRVFGSLKRQDRRVILRHERERRRLGGGFRSILRRTAQEIFDPGLADIGNVLGGQVGRTEVIDDGLDAAVGSTGGDIAFQAVGGPVRPNIKARWPPAEKPIAPMRSGSTLYFFAFDFEPAHRGFHVMNLRGKASLRTKTILG